MTCYIIEISQAPFGESWLYNSDRAKKASNWKEATIFETREDAQAVFKFIEADYLEDALRKGRLIDDKPVVVSLIAMGQPAVKTVAEKTISLTE